MLVTKQGQIKAGDIIRCEFKGRPCRYVAKEVLHAGSEKEVVIVDLEANKYFITSMILDGSSWAKKVHVISQ